MRVYLISNLKGQILSVIYRSVDEELELVFDVERFLGAIFLNIFRVT